MAQDPKPPRPPLTEEAARTLEEILASGGIRGEVPGCPTGLMRPMRVPKKGRAPRRGRAARNG